MNVKLLMQVCTRPDDLWMSAENAWGTREHAGHARCGYLQSLQKDGSVITILQPDIQVKDVLVISSTCSMRRVCDTAPHRQVLLFGWNQRWI